MKHSLILEAHDIEKLQTQIIEALSKLDLQPSRDYNIRCQEQSDQNPPKDDDSQRFYLDEMAKLNNDLTNMQRQLAKANTELANLAELRNRFVGMAAHDLRNPLGVIKNFSDYLLSTMKETATEDQLDILQTIRSTSIFMQRLVEGILDLSALQSGRVSLNLSEVSLDLLFLHSIKLNQTLAAAHHITIDFQQPEEPILARIDAVKIRQVVNNLLSNAVKYSPDGSRITCSLRREGHRSIFCVQDQGIGISKENQAIIFEPFRMISQQHNRGKSVGLGLSIAKNIVDAHSGSLSVESEPGKGSIFCLTLPL